MTASAHNRKSKYWFISAWALLFLMALFWSVDSSFVYICLGAAVFCFFQYVRLSYGKGTQRSEPQRPPARMEHSSAKAVEDLLEEIQKGFKRPSGKIKITLGNVFRFITGFVVIGFVLFVVAAVWIGADTDYYTYLDKASQHNADGNYDSAAYYYRLASLRDPDNPELYYERGNVFLAMERFDSAIVLYDRTLDLHPEHSQALYNKGYAFFAMGRYRQAMEEARKMATYNPQDLQVRLLIGDCYYNQQQVDSALHWYTSAYDDGYRSAPLSHMMAYIYDTRGQTSTAIELYKEALEYDNSIEEIYDRLAELLPPDEAALYRARSGQGAEGSSDW